MWCGPTLSFLLYGSVFIGLVLGLPSLSEISDRKKIFTEDSELPVTVEVLTAEEVDRLLDVITPDTSDRATEDSSSGSLSLIHI